MIAISVHQTTELRTAKELARMLRISLRTLDHMDKKRELPKSVRIGRTRRWRLCDIDSWLESKLLA